MKIALLVLGGLFLLLTGVELVLRKRYGLGNPLLYVADTRMGYRLAPNQNLRVRGNRIVVNQYSMRGDRVEPQRHPETLRVLLLGDSIVNGGWWTDQSQILSQVVRDALVSAEDSGFHQVEVLNASANSWGPRNQLGYVVRFGIFAAQVVLMVLNTDDLFAIAPHSLQLGRSPNYFTRRPPLALLEAVHRARKPPTLPALQDLQDQTGDRVGANLEAIRQLNRLVQQHHSQLLVAMTPLQRELADEGPRDYEQTARQRLEHFTQDQGIPYLDFLPIFSQSASSSLYRDHIHLSPAGNEWVGKALAHFIAQHLPSEAPLLEARPDDLLNDLW